MSFSNNTHKQKTDLVVLLHGLKRSAWDMKILEHYCKQEGFEVINYDYPSTKFPIEELANQLMERLKPYSDRTIHFITHSMGGIVVNTMLSNHELPNAGRIVMIGTPCTGAHLADFFGDWKLFKFLFGPAGQQLRTGEKGICNSVINTPGEIGIIAGGTGKEGGFNPFLPGDNDGTVTVECTRHPHAKDFIVLPYLHIFIHVMPKTAKLAVNFIKTGKFQ